jgi:hypothetical protein
MKSKKTKLPQVIRIIADRPAKGQDSIAGWIGETFDVVCCHKDENDQFDGTVSVRDPKDTKDPQGTYVIQRDEYEVVR